MHNSLTLQLLCDVYVSTVFSLSVVLMAFNSAFAVSWVCAITYRCRWCVCVYFFQNATPRGFFSYMLGGVATPPPPKTGFYPPKNFPKNRVFQNFGGRAAPPEPPAMSFTPPNRHLPHQRKTWKKTPVLLPHFLWDRCHFLLGCSLGIPASEYRLFPCILRTEVYCVPRLWASKSQNFDIPMYIAHPENSLRNPWNLVVIIKVYYFN